MEQEFKEKCNFRWVCFLAGLFWTIALPVAYAFMLKQLLSQGIIITILISPLIAVLWVAAIVVAKGGLAWIIANGKKNLVLHQDYLELYYNYGAQKGKSIRVDYSNIKQFYFVSDGTAKDKLTGKYYVKKGASGSINFSVDFNLVEQFVSPKVNRIMQKYHQKSYEFTASIYNALPAAEYILSQIEENQILHSHNELSKNGTYHPVD